MTDIEAAFVAFISTRSLDSGQVLEVALDKAYPDDSLVQECVEALACYRPEGGDLLFDYASIEPIMKRLQTHLGLGLARG